MRVHAKGVCLQYLAACGMGLAVGKCLHPRPGAEILAAAVAPPLTGAPLPRAPPLPAGPASPVGPAEMDPSDCCFSSFISVFLSLDIQSCHHF